jgi:tetratricopeptide (TPR) repeat protein
MLNLPKLTLLAALPLLFTTQLASANEYDALIKARKFPEAERAASAKLAKEATNPEAMIGRINAILGAGAESRIGEAVKYSQQCISANPAVAGCHLALGKTLGWKAMTGGVMSALGYAGDMRDAFKKAVELDPRNMDARFSLLQFYMMAPGIMGGGTGKAETLAAQTAALTPEAGRIMTGMLDLAADRTAKAEAGAMAMRPGTDEELNERQESLLASVGNSYLHDKKYADAERVLREGQKRFPEGDDAPYLLARVQQEQGKHREAVAVLEQQVAKQARARIHYRMGQSLQALGEKAKAASAFEKAVALKTGLSGKQLSDAQAQISALKG